MHLLDAMKSRHSQRAFLDEPIPRATLEKILEAARWAPSGVNTQPWRVHVLTGASRHALGEKLEALRRSGVEPNPDYQYYPDVWRDPYKSRRKDCGMALYAALGIGRQDADKQMDAWCANYRFFDAPAGLLFFMDRDMGQGSWLDMGMFMQNVMLAARAEELASCPQAALADYPDVVRQALGVGPEQMLLAGLALGRPTPDAAVNRLGLSREPVEGFAVFHE